MKAINDETTIHMYILSQTEHLTAYRFISHLFIIKGKHNVAMITLLKRNVRVD